MGAANTANKSGGESTFPAKVTSSIPPSLSPPLLNHIQLSNWKYYNIVLWFCQGLLNLLFSLELATRNQQPKAIKAKSLPVAI
jgi:hypothetical protein